jgi:hypothetical protein
MVEDEVGEHYHFVRATSEELSKKHVTVRFGPFLRGDGYGMELIGHGEEDKKRVQEWVQKEYPVLYQKREEISALLHENSKPYHEVRYLFRERNQIDEEIFSSEREKYWNDIVLAYKVMTSAF